MAGLRIRMKRLGDGAALLAVSGYLDAHTFEEMEKVMERLFDANIYKIIVDLSQLSYISSAGAGVFISKVGQATENGGNIVFLRPSEPVMEVFDLLGLTQIFPIVYSEQEALAQFGLAP